MSQADIVELISRRVAEQISAQMAHFEQQLSQLFQQHFARLNARLDLFEARVSERAKLPEVLAPLPASEIISPVEIVSEVDEEQLSVLSSDPSSASLSVSPPLGESEIQILPKVSVSEWVLVLEKRLLQATQFPFVSTKAVLALVDTIRGRVGGFPFDPGLLAKCLLC